MSALPTVGAAAFRDLDRVPGPLGAGLGLPVGLAAVFLTWSVGGNPTAGLVLASIAAAAVAAVTTIPGGTVAGGLCWACYDGFVVNRLGTLTVGQAELVAFAIVVTTALVTGIAANLLRKLVDVCLRDDRGIGPREPAG